MTIRKAHESDAVAIASVHVASWRSTYRGIVPDDFLENLSQSDRERQWRETCSECAGPRCVFVADDPTDGIVGFASGGPSRDEMGGCSGELYAIYLLDQHQGRGIGRQLFQAVATHLSDSGISSLHTWVLAENPAIGFYEALGGQLVAEKPIEFGGRTLQELAYAWPSHSPCLQLDGGTSDSDVSC